MSQKKRPPSTEVVTYATPPLRLASGDSVAGKYTVVEHYGAGPLGHTFRVNDAAGEPVALKIVAHELVPTVAEQEGLVGEILKLAGHEMKRVAIPTDAGLHDGTVYIVSRWVRGRSLRRVLGAYRDAGRVMPHNEVLGVLEGVVHALRELHTVAAHGALYPESVQIAVDGGVHLTDAGLAGAVSRARLIDHFERYPDVMAYLSPDIRGGKRSSAGSDLYSVGALASELLTGDPGSAAAGIAAPMLAGLPSETVDALQGLMDLTPAVRAGALPALLGALARSIGARSVPPTAALPDQRARTEHMPTDVAREASRGRRGRG